MAKYLPVTRNRDVGAQSCLWGRIYWQSYGRNIRIVCARVVCEWSRWNKSLPRSRLASLLSHPHHRSDSVT